MIMKLSISIFYFLLVLSSCVETKTCDLAIKNASLFDSKTGRVLSNRTILVNADTIADVTGSKKNYRAKDTIDAKGRLVTPGFVDGHIHPTDVFGDYSDAPEYLPKDSLDLLRKKLSDNFLP